MHHDTSDLDWALHKGIQPKFWELLPKYLSGYISSTAGYNNVISLDYGQYSYNQFIRNLSL